MYELIKRLQDFAAGTKLDEDALLAFDASDAIQELMNDLEQSRHYEEFWQHEAEEALRKYQVAISRKPQWIPVTERLPKMCERVLTYSQREGIRDNFINGYNQWDRVKFGRVTHWMPLPEPPKEDEA